MTVMRIVLFIADIAVIGGKCLSLIEAHDAALEDSESITEAQLKFETILSAPSLESAANKITQLAKSKELDSTLLLLITKAWAAAQDSTTMEQEVVFLSLGLCHVFAFGYVVRFHISSCCC